MNDIAKKAISDKLITALQSEKLNKSAVARGLGVLPTYISMICNPKQWDKCSQGAWEAVRAWTNTGDPLKVHIEKLKSKTPQLKEGVAQTRIPKETPRDKGMPPPAGGVTVSPGEEPVKVYFDRPKTLPEQNEFSKVKIEIDIIIKINGKEIAL